MPAPSTLESRGITIKKVKEPAAKPPADEEKKADDATKPADSAAKEGDNFNWGDSMESSLGWKQPQASSGGEKPKEEAKKEEPAQKAKEGDDGKSEEERGEVKKTPEAKASPPAEDASKVAELAADKAVQKLRQEQQRALAAAEEEKRAAASSQAKEGVEEIDPEDAHKRAVIEMMAQKDPKFAELPKQFDRFLKQESAYRKEWEKANPGKQFDPDDESHTEWYDKHEPTIDPKTFYRAEARYLAAQEVEQREREKEAKLSAERQQQEASGLVKSVTKAATDEIINRIAPDLAKKVGGDLDKLDELDPAAGIVARRHAEQAAMVLPEVVKLLHPAGSGKLDLENPVHQQIVKQVTLIEETLKSKPSAETAYQGRQFTDMDTYLKMSPRERLGYWTIWNQPNMVSGIIANNFAKEAEARIQKIRGSGKVSSEAAGRNSSQAKGSEKRDEAASSVKKQSPPNTAHRSDTTTQGGSGGGGGGGFGEIAMRALFE